MADQLAQLLAQNPYYVSGANFARQNFITEDMKPWEAFALQAAQGLGSGLLAGYGKSQVEQEVEQDNAALAQALAQPTLDKKITALGIKHPELAQALMIKKVEADVDAERDYAKDMRDLLNKRQLMEAEDRIKNPHRYRDNIGAGPNTAPSEPEMFPGGPPSVEAEFERIMQEQIERGATPTAAADVATALTAAKRKAMTGSVDLVAEARRQASELNNIVSTAEASMPGAGETGGMLGPIRNLGSRMAAAFGNDDQQSKQAYTSQLDSVMPKIISSSRTPGVGAMEKSEMQMYLGAGPSSSKTPEENRMLIDRMKAIAQLETQYADFMETYRESKGTTQGADKYWQAYIKDNPLFSMRQDGQYIANTDRKGWQDYLYGNGAIATRGEQPRTLDPAVTQTPSAPQMVTIKNRRTGETQIVTAEQAASLQGGR